MGGESKELAHTHIPPRQQRDIALFESLTELVDDFIGVLGDNLHLPVEVDVEVEETRQGKVRDTYRTKNRIGVSQTMCEN